MSFLRNISRHTQPRFEHARWAPSPILRYSTEAGAVATVPPLLQKLKGDLKTAMRAKDASRLTVLRSIMAANLNASKTASPIKTDVQLVSLIRRIQRETKQSVDEATQAGRSDLAEKNQAEVDVLESIVADSGVQNVSAEDIQKLVDEIVASLAGQGATTMKAIMGKANEALEGKVFDRKSLADAAKKAVKS